MGLCEVLASLAHAVARGQGGDPRVTLLAHLLRAAPVYRDASRLDAWEQAYTHARGNDSPSTAVDLLDGIFDLGTYNIYGAFDVPGTKEEYLRVVQKLQQAGIGTPPADDMSQW
jgi:hypothetical protein